MSKNEFETKVCCICGDALLPNECNNAEPLVVNGNGIEAVCCDYCNTHKVIPYRMIDVVVKDPIIRVMAKTTFIYEWIKDSNTMKLSYLAMMKAENLQFNNKEGK